MQDKMSVCILSALDMTELAGISGKRALQAFMRLGYAVVRQRGSHVRLRHRTDPARRPITIPLHKEIGIGLMPRLIKDAGVDIKNFLELL